MLPGVKTQFVRGSSGSVAPPTVAVLKSNFLVLDQNICMRPDLVRILICQIFQCRIPCSLIDLKVKTSFRSYQIPSHILSKAQSFRNYSPLVSVQLWSQVSRRQIRACQFGNCCL